MAFPMKFSRTQQRPMPALDREPAIMILQRFVGAYALSGGSSGAWSPALCSSGADDYRSKNFGESYLLAEIAAQVLEAQGFRIKRKLGLGGTLIC